MMQGTKAMKIVASGMRSLGRVVRVALLCGLVPAAASAHNALISCFDNKDGTVTCEAGYSDGSPAAGQMVRVMEANRRLIIEEKFDKANSFTFKRPDTNFLVEFIGDTSHIATFDGDDLN
jgi:hypothetical protein